MKVKAKDVRKDMNNISIRGKIVSIEEEKIVNTINGKAKIARAIIEDETGRVNLTLWNEQIEKIGIGKVIEIHRAYVVHYKGNLSLNVPRNGKIIQL
ncbi:MAG: OB-fold nucleic acid binding domain-containing protein [Thermoproteota archaeon]|jgi:OB-fold nucleic acid binding domain.